MKRALAVLTLAAAIAIPAATGAVEQSVRHVRHAEGRCRHRLDRHLQRRPEELQPRPGGRRQAQQGAPGHLHFQMDGGKFDFPKYSGANGDAREGARHRGHVLAVDRADDRLQAPAGRQAHADRVPREQRPLAGGRQGDDPLHGALTMRAAATVLLVAAACTVATPGVSLRRRARRATAGHDPHGDFFYRPARHGARRPEGALRQRRQDRAHRRRHRPPRARPLEADQAACPEHGQGQTVTFARPGVVHYLCTFHPTLMRGTITVVR